MIKLLIVEDEPLVQVGIKSMLPWNEYGIEVCGAAFNGKQALELIEQHSPEIVITDIKMPIMDGLTLAKKCQEIYGKFPLFIILTSYEEFPLVKEAIQYGIIDYLIKIELTADILEQPIKKALKIIQESKNTPSQKVPTIHNFYDKFFISLLHNLFEDENQFLLQTKDLKLTFTAKSYMASYCTIGMADNNPLEQEKLIKLYYSTIQMLKEIISKYIPCYIPSLDLKHFCIIFSIEDTIHYKEVITTALKSALTMIYNYFNITVCSSIGSICTRPLEISDSYQEARQIQSYCTLNQPIIFFDDIYSSSTNIEKNTFNMGVFKKSIYQAFEEFEPEILMNTLTQVIELFSVHPGKYLQALDACSNILHLSISLLPEGEETVEEIFANYTDGYHSLYKQMNMEQLIHWLEQLRDGLYHVLKTRHITYKNLVLSNVKNYIDEHIEEKLSLNDIASIFGMHPNYLSLQFKKLLILDSLTILRGKK